MSGIDRGTRDRLVAGLLDDAQRIRAQLFRSVTVYAFAGRDGTYQSHRLSRPSARDQADMMRAATMALSAALTLDRSAPYAPVDNARSMLGDLADALDVAYEQITAAEVQD